MNINHVPLWREIIKLVSLNFIKYKELFQGQDTNGPPFNYFDITDFLYFYCTVIVNWRQF